MGAAPSGVETRKVVEHPASSDAATTRAMARSEFMGPPVHRPARRAGATMYQMRYIAIDLGDKRTGLAIGDAETRLVTPLQVLESPISIRNGEQLLEDLDKAINEQVSPHAAAELVVGLPLNMD